MAWEFVKSGMEGNCEFLGANIFDLEWQNTGQHVQVKDPVYNRNHTFDIWQVIIDDKPRQFAAGEFSNCVWGFYLKKG